MAVQAATPKKTRGEGPVSIMYVDADNKEHKRVPTNVSQVKVAGKNGKAKNYAVDTLPPAIRNQLAAFALGKRMDIFVRNSADDNGVVDVVKCADEVFALLKAGTFYARGEGKGGPGRSFDFDKWVTIIKNAAAMKAKNDKSGKSKPATDKQLADVRLQLESFTPKERTERIKKQRSSNPFFVLAEKEHGMQQAKEDIAAGEFGADELF